MRQDWQRDWEVNGIVVFAVAGIGSLQVGSSAGKETDTVVVAASSTESFSGRNKGLVLALRFRSRFRRSKDVDSASWRKAGGKG